MFGAVQRLCLVTTSSLSVLLSTYHVTQKCHPRRHGAWRALSGEVMSGDVMAMLFKEDIDPSRLRVAYLAERVQLEQERRREQVRLEQERRHLEQQRHAFEKKYLMERVNRERADRLAADRGADILRAHGMMHVRGVFEYQETQIKAMFDALGTPLKDPTRTTLWEAYLNQPDGKLLKSGIAKLCIKGKKPHESLAEVYSQLSAHVHTTMSPVVSQGFGSRVLIVQGALSLKQCFIVELFCKHFKYNYKLCLQNLASVEDNDATSDK